MKIQINELFRIASDPNQWIVQSRRTRKGRQDWESVGFFSTFPSALEFLRERLVRESQAETLADALLEVERASTTLSRALKPIAAEDVSPSLFLLQLEHGSLEAAGDLMARRIDNWFKDLKTAKRQFGTGELVRALKQSSRIG